VKQQYFASKQTIRMSIARTKQFAEGLEKKINRDDFVAECERIAAEHNWLYPKQKITAASVRQSFVGQFQEEQKHLKKLHEAIWYAK
jgi:hypothetical protein